MSNVSAGLFIGLIVLAVAVALLLVFRRRQATVQEDHYTHGLEKWLAGDLNAARTALRAAIERDPAAVDPYLQLGNLLRLQGDAKRAAVIHRGLTVRNDVPLAKRTSISLALAEDLLALGSWEEAGKVLNGLESAAGGSPRFWRARFAQRLGGGDEQAAGGALRTGASRCADQDGKLFRLQYGLFQLDRALRLCRDRQPGGAKRLLKEVPSLPELNSKVSFVRALIAAQQGEVEQAVGIATGGLMDAPEEMELFLPALRAALLESGHYERTIPILESASQSETAPASLWIALALLYEKMDQREKAIRLLEDKSQDPRLTPDVAAPLLRLLAAENRSSDWGRIWHCLHLPQSAAVWRCRVCGDVQDQIRWFCSNCHSFTSHHAVSH